MPLRAFGIEASPWRLPAPHGWASILHKAVIVFGSSQAAWFFLAKTLPPLASGIGMMMIPVLGVFSGAHFLGELLHWQDLAAVVLIVVAIAALLRR